MDQPILRWHHQATQIQTVPGPAQTFIVPVGQPGDGWRLENANDKPISVESLQLTARYKRWGTYGESTREIGNTRLPPGCELQLRPPKLPWFAALLSHTLTIVVTYGNLRYKLADYKRTDLFASHISLALHFHDRVWEE